jgi:hypothetical protein
MIPDRKKGNSRKAATTRIIRFFPSSNVKQNKSHRQFLREQVKRTSQKQKRLLFDKRRKDRNRANKEVEKTKKKLKTIENSAKENRPKSQQYTSWGGVSKECKENPHPTVSGCQSRLL